MVGAFERDVHGVHRRRHGVRIGALEEQEARDRQRVGRARDRAAERLEAAGGLQQRERLAVAPEMSSPGWGSATRSMRSTMSADSMRPPACRNAEASSRSIVRFVRPQNSALRSRT